MSGTDQRGDERASEVANEVAIDCAALDAYEVPATPEGLEARLWERLRPAPPVRGRRWWLAAGLAAVGVAASAAWWVAARAPVPARAGAVKAAARSTVVIDQATLVAEPGTQLSWAAGEGGVRVEQRTGNVFYRVERGRPFVVVTDVGEVRVLGTCFRVEVRSMKVPKQGLVGGAIGALVTAGVFVAVFEGKVSLANDAGRVEIAAGQSAQIGGARDTVAGAPAMTNADVVGLAPAVRGAAAAADPRGATGTAASAAAASADGPMTAAGTSAFAREERDPTWAPAQEEAIRTRLRKHLGIAPDLYALECRTRCCLARIPASIYDERQRELMSNVGLGGNDEETAYVSQGEENMVAAQLCFRRTDGHDPDRGAELEALLAAIRPELAACARGLTHEVTVSVELSLDESGAVTKADTRSDPTGEPASACVERVVVGAAGFAPASAAATVPVRVTLPLR